MIDAGLLFFFHLDLEDGHVPTFELLGDCLLGGLRRNFGTM